MCSFNPHTHAGCDIEITDAQVIEEVSIHTPTQGVTSTCAKYVLIVVVSIHTPTQGVTYPIFVR